MFGLAQMNSRKEMKRRHAQTRNLAIASTWLVDMAHAIIALHTI